MCAAHRDPIQIEEKEIALKRHTGKKAERGEEFDKLKQRSDALEKENLDVVQKLKRMIEKENLDKHEKQKHEKMKMELINQRAVELNKLAEVIQSFTIQTKIKAPEI